MVRKNLNIIVIILLLPAFVLAQSTKEIKNKKNQLKSIQSEILSLERSLNSKSDVEKKTVTTLKLIDRQKILINRALKKLNKEEKAKEKEVVKLNKQLKKLDSKIKKLQNDYAAYIVWLYKQGKDSSIKLILKAHTINQALVRYKYLSSITDKNAKRLNELNLTVRKFKKVKDSAIRKKNELKNLTAQKNNEKKLLEKRKTEKENLIKDLKNDEHALAEEITKKRHNEILIKNLIADLIEKERIRKEKLHAERLEGKNVKMPAEYDYSKFKNFSQLEGKLNWPVESKDVVREFGENENKKLKTVTLNYGIDIKTKKSAEVHAVAEGIVSIIDWIPGYGSVVIVTHKNEFRTVYGHLTKIEVEEGNKVEAGDLLGYVNENLEGNILHFEIWNARNYQNPEDWLVKK